MNFKSLKLQIPEYKTKSYYKKTKTIYSSKQINLIILIQKSWRNFVNRINLSNYSKYDLVKLLLTNKISYRTRLFIHMKNISFRYYGITNFAESDDNIIKAKICELTKIHKQDHKDRIVKQLIITESIKENSKIYIRGSCNVTNNNNSNYFIDLNWIKNAFNYLLDIDSSPTSMTPESVKKITFEDKKPIIYWTKREPWSVDNGKAFINECLNKHARCPNSRIWVKNNNLNLKDFDKISKKGLPLF